MSFWDVIPHIPARTPVWVWLLLIWLTWDGLRSMRDRRVATRVFWLLPLFAVLAVQERLNTARPDIDAPVFLVAYAAGGVFGHWFQGQVLIERAPGHVVVRGEALTMIALMTLFWTHFAREVIEATSPDLLMRPSLIAGLAALTGAVSGQFGGRAFRVLRAPVDASTR